MQKAGTAAALIERTEIGKAKIRFRSSVREPIRHPNGPIKFNRQPDKRALFRYAMHTLPSQVDETIGTPTLFAAWNAAIYVGQIEDARLDMILGSRKYLDVTRDVLRKHGGLWFWDESYSITRRRD